MFDTQTAPPLVTVDMLEDHQMPGPYTETDVAIASALVRGACGWHIAPSVAVELELDSDGGTLLVLPSLHLSSVNKVTDRHGNVLEGWEASRKGMLYRTAGWPAGFGAVVVHAEHGLPEVPLEIVAVVADLARSRTATGMRPTDLKSRKVGEVTYSYLTPADSPTDDPLRMYRHVLWRFVLP